MDFRRSAIGCVAVLSCVISTGVLADDYDYIECSDAAKIVMDAKYGSDLNNVPASEKTECIQTRRNLKIVVAWNSNAINAKKKYGQQVVNVENMMDLYATTFAIKASEIDMVVMGYQGGASWLLTDAGYDAHHGTVSTTDAAVPNPARAAVEGLLAKGVKIFACQNTMASNGYLTKELIPGVKMVPGGVSGFVDYQFRGYKGITP